ncbi:MAG: FAD-dependent oxidoreductase [Erysipelotrichaceae bacterium]|nr:FAD-dependent oxidoreductase [Erysipelotrichaceae bacterium]
MYDITIIGAGIIGSLIAHDLSKFNLKVLVLERRMM